MFKLVKKGFDKANIISFGNMFLIGNGHLGYKGTLEEYNKEQMPSLNVVGVYDKYQNKWRESINMPNPFFAVVKSSEQDWVWEKQTKANRLACTHPISQMPPHPVPEGWPLYGWPPRSSSSDQVIREH